MINFELIYISAILEFILESNCHLSITSCNCEISKNGPNKDLSITVTKVSDSFVFFIVSTFNEIGAISSTFWNFLNNGFKK